MSTVRREKSNVAAALNVIDQTNNDGCVGIRIVEFLVQRHVEDG